jgi:N-methylhydantoinase B
LELLEEQADVFLFGERGRFAPPGVAGGGNAAMTQFSFPQNGGRGTPPMVSKMVGLSIRRGERLLLETPGGGGYGTARQRPVADVQRDVRLGYVSVEAARRDYGVAITPAGGIDDAATSALRRKAAE